MAGQVHHRDRRYVILGKLVRDTAKANPHAICWRDGMTLAQHAARYPTRRLAWHAGHTRKGSRTWQPWLNVHEQPPPGDWLAPEVSTCNIGHGNREREPHTERW